MQHRERGVAIHLGCGVAELGVESGGVAAIVTTDTAATMIVSSHTQRLVVKVSQPLELVLAPVRLPPGTVPLMCPVAGPGAATAPARYASPMIFPNTAAARDAGPIVRSGAWYPGTGEPYTSAYSCG